MNPTASASKKRLAALERIFTAEIENRLPVQSKAKVFYDLWADGLVEMDRKQYGAVIVDGWCLTHAGRLLYCSSCEGKETGPGFGGRRA